MESSTRYIGDNFIILEHDLSESITWFWFLCYFSGRTESIYFVLFFNIPFICVIWSMMLSMDPDVSMNSVWWALFCLLCAPVTTLPLLYPKGNKEYTNDGVLISSYIPSPNYPLMLRPHENTSPFDVNMNVCSAPHVIDVILRLFKELMSVGLRSWVIPSTPNYPNLLLPHPNTSLRVLM